MGNFQFCIRTVVAFRLHARTANTRDCRTGVLAWARLSRVKQSRTPFALLPEVLK